MRIVKISLYISISILIIILSGDLGDAQSINSNSCDASLWNHVWGENQNHTWRLKLNLTYPCITVTGTIKFINVEHDGDNHVGLQLDKQYTFLLNQVNIANGDANENLIIEVICANPNAEDAPARAACGNFTQNFPIATGQHVRVTGAYVTDVASTGWNEIHPITSIEQISNTTIYPNLTPVKTPSPSPTNTPFTPVQTQITEVTTVITPPETETPETPEIPVASPVETKGPKTPGFELNISILGFSIIYLIKKVKN